MIQHNPTDINSYLLKLANEMGHERMWLEDFKVLGSGYSSDFKRKIISLFLYVSSILSYVHFFLKNEILLFLSKLD